MRQSINPLYIGEALEYFVTHASMNLYDNDIPINLMDIFPMLKQRFCLENTLLLVLHEYFEINNLVDQSTAMMHPDELFHISFGGDIPALWYKYIDSNKEVKVVMREAIDTGLILNPLNTYEIIQGEMENFDHTVIDNSVLSTIMELNYIKYKDTPDFDIYPLDQNVIDALSEEYGLARNIIHILRIFLRPIKEKILIAKQKGKNIPQESLGSIDVYIFMKLALDHGFQHILDKLVNHPNVNKLYSGIIIDDVNQVNHYLNTIDPRDNKYRAYYLAIEGRNQTIIDSIKNNIIQRDLLEQEVVRKEIQSQIGPTNIPQILYSHSRKKFNY
jgi:hypothetical protein